MSCCRNQPACNNIGTLKYMKYITIVISVIAIIYITLVYSMSESNKCCDLQTKECQECARKIRINKFCAAHDHPNTYGCNNKTLIAICACTRSLSMWKSVRDSSLQSILIPSITRTVALDDRKKYEFILFLGINSDDTFWKNNIKHITTPSWLPLKSHFYVLEKQNKIPFNYLMNDAAKFGVEYLVRINDDTEFITSNWIDLAVSTLKSFVPTNVGVVGPKCNEGATDILTHDMVHRTHLEIFNVYYPDIFSAWWVDDWITHVYGSNRTKHLENWIVKHHVNKHGTRYRVQDYQKSFLTHEITKGQFQLQYWLNKTQR